MKTVKTALDLLRRVARASAPVSVGELAAATGHSKSKISKLLATLRDSGFLEQDPETRRYTTGLAAFIAGAAHARANPLAREALPIMREVVDACGHTATLSVMRGDDVTHLMAVEGPLFLDGRWRVGLSLPYHATSAGKVLVAHMPASEVDTLLARAPLAALTPLTIVDPAAFKEQLRAVRASGSAVSRGESAPGLAALAVPVYGPDDAAVAALGLIVPDRMFGAARAGALLAILHDAARRLSNRLGASVYPHGKAQSAPRPRLHARARA